MKIYNSTEYFDRDKETELYYQLSVINQWDWSTKIICRDTLSDGTRISYSLRQDNPHKNMLPEDITEEIKNELVKMGYAL